jgi:hypothetical protein
VLRIHALAGLGAVALAAVWASGRLADRVALRAAAGLDATLGSAWRAAQAEPAAATPQAIVLPAPEPAEPSAPAVPLAAGRGRGAKARPAPKRGVRVSSAAVLRLANSGARPAGAPVPASAGCPAGLRLSGVGALGVGLRDGDVLTHAGGSPATSSGAVVGMVIAARGARQREIAGRFCRAGELYNLVVEQPYLD